jgi:hypothetical protein
MSYNKAPSITAETINPKVRIFNYEPCGEIVRHSEVTFPPADRPSPPPVEPAN